MERKLASIQLIKSVEPIIKADRIEQVTVMGWTVVVKKSDNLKPGDKIIYVEYDSILPEKEWSEFMRPRKFRVKTAKLRDILSQGLVFLTSLFPGTEDMEVGTDVTELLGITKYELPVPKDQKVAGNFPPLVPKTDEIRLQSCPKVIEEIRKVPFYISTKCDGTSGTFGKLDDKFFVCSRNWDLKPGSNNYWNMAEKYNLENVIPDNFTVQGEIVGPGIQKNKLGLKSVDLYCFNVFDIKGGKYLDYYNFINWCKKFNLKTVPIEKIIDPNKDEFDFSLKSWLKLAEGNYEGTDHAKEGIVIRPINEIHSRTLQGRLSFKVISNKFLLITGE